MDVQWLGEQIKMLTLEIAAVRGEAARQLAEKDREIAALKKATDPDRAEATAFAQSNTE